MNSTTKQSIVLNKLMAKYPLTIFLGKHDGKSILLRRPSFECDWYWGFGYIGNKNLHTHLDCLSERNIQLVKTCNSMATNTRASRF